MTSGWGKTLSCRHLTGICSWCQLRGKQRLPGCLCPALTEKQKEQERSDCSPGSENRRKLLIFFFFLRRATSLLKTRDKQPHLITQSEKSSQSAWGTQEPGLAHHTRTAIDHWGLRHWGWVTVWEKFGQSSWNGVTGGLCAWRVESWKPRW